MKTYVCSVTPNPALDLSGQVANIIPNEKSYVTNPSRHPGGNAINSARILNRLKVPVICTGFLGGTTGKEVASLLAQEKMKTEFIPIEESTRINVTVSNSKDHNQTRLTFPGPRIKTAEKDRLFHYLKKSKNISHLLIGGSFPPGLSVKDVLEMAAIARGQGIPTIIDCPGDLLRRLLAAHPLLIKPNLIEFQQLVGKRITSLPAIVRAAQALLPKVEMICISSVAGGTLLVTNQGVCFGKIAPVKIKSTVGAGDSMVGAMVSQLYKGNKDPQDLLRWGLAGSAATLSNSGTALGSAAQIKKLYRKTKVQVL